MPLSALISHISSLRYRYMSTCHRVNVKFCISLYHVATRHTTTKWVYIGDCWVLHLIWIIIILWRSIRYAPNLKTTEEINARNRWNNARISRYIQLHLAIHRTSHMRHYVSPSEFEIVRQKNSILPQVMASNLINIYFNPISAHLLLLSGSANGVAMTSYARVLALMCSWLPQNH